jgi:hypothetical protein
MKDLRELALVGCCASGSFDTAVAGGSSFDVAHADSNACTLAPTAMPLSDSDTTDEIREGETTIENVIKNLTILKNNS